MTTPPPYWGSDENDRDRAAGSSARSRSLTTSNSGLAANDALMSVARQALERARGLFLEAEQMRATAAEELTSARQDAERIRERARAQVELETTELNAQVHEQYVRQSRALNDERSFLQRALQEAETFSAEARHLREETERELARARTLHAEAEGIREEALNLLTRATVGDYPRTLPEPPSGEPEIFPFSMERDAAVSMPMRPRPRPNTDPAPRASDDPFRAPNPPADSPGVGRYAPEPRWAQTPSGETARDSGRGFDDPPEEDASASELGDALSDMLASSFEQPVASTNMPMPTPPVASPTPEREPEYEVPEPARAEEAARAQSAPAPAVPATYTGEITILVAPSPSAEVVGLVWSAIEELVGIGRVTASAASKDRSGLQLTLDLEDDVLAIAALQSALPSLTVSGVDPTHLVIIP